AVLAMLVRCPASKGLAARWVGRPRAPDGDASGTGGSSGRRCRAAGASGAPCRLARPGPRSERARPARLAIAGRTSLRGGLAVVAGHGWGFSGRAAAVRRAIAGVATVAPAAREPRAAIRAGLRPQRHSRPRAPPKPAMRQTSVASGVLQGLGGRATTGAQRPRRPFPQSLAH